MVEKRSNRFFKFKKMLMYVVAYVSNPSHFKFEKMLRLFMLQIPLSFLLLSLLLMCQIPLSSLTVLIASI